MNTSIDKILQLLGATYLRTSLLEEERESLKAENARLQKQIEELKPKKNDTPNK